MLPITGWIIYYESIIPSQKEYIKKMISQAKKYNIQLALIIIEKIEYGISNNKPYIKYENKNPTLPDFVISRVFDVLLTRQFENLGIRVFNPSKVSSITRNKAETHQFLSRFEIPMLDTLFRTVKDSIPFEFHFIVKGLHGQRGNQVYMAHSKKELNEILKNLNSISHLFQKVADVKGEDVRVYTLGSEIVLSLKRTAKNDFRTNRELGATVQPFLLKINDISLVKKIVDLLNSDFVAIDLLIASDGSLVVNEVNSVPGLSLLLEYEPDFFKKYFRYIRLCF